MWGGLLTIMEKIKVEKVLISKQGKKSHNYEKFKKVVSEKKVQIMVVQKRRYNRD